MSSAHCEEKIDETDTRLEYTPWKSLGCLAQETGIPNHQHELPQNS
jgi:hypothetical protein